MITTRKLLDMRKYKIVLIFCSALISIATIDAQQNTQYTQFMYSKLWLNPGYAGSHNLGCVQAISRNQWLGFEGAPVSQSINFHTPLFGDKVGLGFSLNHDQLGPTDSWFFNLSYAYRIKTEKGRLALGLQANLTQYEIDFQQLFTLESGDGIVPDISSSKMIPNFGVGLYYNTDKFFIGVSVPLIIQGDLNFDDGNLSSFLSRQELHSYLMAGLVHRISDRIQGKPSILLKKVTNSPFDFDINYSLIFFDRLWAGASYRLGGDQNNGIGESIDFTVQYQLSHALRIGAAYDFTLSRLQSVNDGSIEFLAQMCISHKSEKLTNPRFF